MTAVRALRVALGSLGVGLMVVAAAGILRDRGFTDPPGLGLWLAGGVVAHDFVLAPLSLAVAVLASRLVPARARPVVGYGLVTAGVVLVVGLPVLLASHRGRANPTILGRDYATGLLVAELVIVASTAMVTVFVLRRSRRGQAAAEVTPPGEPG